MSIINLIGILVVYIGYWIFFGRDPKVIGICIWRALGLSIPTFMGAIVGIVEIYHFLFLYLKFLVNQVSESYVALFPVVLFLILSLIVYLILVGLYLLFLKIFWSNPPHVHPQILDILIWLAPSVLILTNKPGISFMQKV